jgi:hypothetical protein
MVHIKLDVLTVYIAQPGGGMDVRCGIMATRTEYRQPVIVGFHFTQTLDYTRVKGNFLSLFFGRWTRTFRIGKVYKDGQQIRK